MNNYKTAVEAIDEIEDSKSIVQLFELMLSKVTIGTIQQIADLEGKSYNGIKNSNCYCKIDLNGKRLVVTGVRQGILPF